MEGTVTQSGDSAVGGASGTAGASGTGPGVRTVTQQEHDVASQSSAPSAQEQRLDEGLSYTDIEEIRQLPAASGAGADATDGRRSSAYTTVALSPVDESKAARGVSARYEAFIEDDLAIPRVQEAEKEHVGLSQASSGTQQQPLVGGDRAGPPVDRQSEFEVAKRTIALTPYEKKQRMQHLRAVGESFQRDVQDTLKDFPRVCLHDREVQVGGRRVLLTSFTEEDRESIQEATGLRFVDVGGRAGGVKAVHEGRGLFLKFAFDQDGFYESATMAAKAAKREAAASRWVHALDSVHVSTPLLQCVDLLVRSGAGLRLLRVQVFASVGVRGFEAGEPDTWLATTLRVGSSDGGDSILADEEQVQEVVKPLASHFFVGPHIQEGTSRVLSFSYARAEPGADEGDVEDPSASDSPDAATGTGGPHKSFLDYLVRERGVDEAAVAGLRRDCSRRDQATEGGSGDGTRANSLRMSATERALAEEIQSTVRASGADLDHRVDRRHVKAKAAMRTGESLSVELRLPFDVEVHQLDSGQRMVLDTHRLLLPDVAWMDWVRRSEEARPRLWTVDLRARDAPGLQGSLGSFNVRPRPAWGADATRLSEALRDWAAESLESAGYAFPPGSMQRFPDAGCVVAFGFRSECIGVDAAAPSEGGAGGGGEPVVEPPDGADRSGPSIAVVVSCPRWYYCGNSRLTCLLPPEAAHRLSDLCPEECAGISPDGIMRGKREELSTARESQQLLYAVAADEGPAALLEELQAQNQPALEAGGPTGGLSALPLEAYRSALKRTMHGLGLGLRHARLILDDEELKDHRNMLYKSLAQPLRRGSLAADACAKVVAAIRRAASDALNSEGAVAAVLQARCFAAKGIVSCRPSGEERPASNPSPLVLASADGPGSLVQMYAGGSCVGVDLAVASTGVRLVKGDGVKAAIRELAHLQRVGGSMEGGYLQELAKLCQRSSGTWPEMLQSTVRHASVQCAEDRLPGLLLSVARRLNSMGRYGEALVILREGSRFIEQSFGKLNSAYTTLATEMADNLVKLGRLGEALELHQECKRIHESTGRKEPFYATTLNNMGDCLKSMGRYAEALELHRQCRAVRETTTGKSDPDYATTLNNIASCLDAMGKFGEAIGLYMECRDIRASLLGEHHPDYANAINNVAFCLFSMGRYDEALEMLHETKRIKAESLGKAHPDYATTLNNIGSCLDSIGRCPEAMALYEECRDITKEQLGEEHPLYAAALNNIGLCFASMERFGEALPVYQECRALRKRLLGEAHPDYASTLNNMASCLDSLGRFPEALELQEECLRSKEAALGAGHPSYATTLNNMAYCLFSLGRRDDAVSRLKECVEVRRAALGTGHPDFATALDSLANCLQAMGRHAEALGYHRECLGVLVALFGKGHPRSVATLQNIAECCMQLGKIEELQLVLQELEAVGGR